MGKKKGKGKKTEDGSQQSSTSDVQTSKAQSSEPKPQPPKPEPQQESQKKQQKQGAQQSMQHQHAGPSTQASQQPSSVPQQPQAWGVQQVSQPVQQQHTDISQTSVNAPQQQRQLGGRGRQGVQQPEQQVGAPQQQQVSGSRGWQRVQQPMQQVGPPSAGPTAHQQQQVLGGRGWQGAQQPSAGPTAHQQQQVLGGRGWQGAQQQVGPPPAGPPVPQQQQVLGSRGWQGAQQPMQQVGPPPARPPVPQQRQVSGGRGRQDIQQQPRQQQVGEPVQPRQQPQVGGDGQQRKAGQQQPKGRQQTTAAGPGKGVKDITSEVSKLQMGPLVPMRFRKSEPGTAGRKIPIESNHLQLTLGNLNKAFHYDVQLEPDTPKKFLRHVMELFRQQHYPKRYPAFDGRKNLYSTSKLPFGDIISDKIIIRDQDREKEYKVKVQFANEVDLTPLKNLSLSQATPTEALQVVDIVLRCAPAQNLLQIGRSFFHKPAGTIIDLGEGMEMYHGFYQSAVRAWKPLLNVDVAHKPFPKAMPVIDALLEVINADKFDDRKLTRDHLSRPLGEQDLKVFEKFIKQLRIVYEIPGMPGSRRSYKVNSINGSPDKKTFQTDDGKTITIQTYFEREKRCRLRYPCMPTLWVGSPNRKDNPILVPIEFCTLEPNQTVNRKMTEGQTRNMIRYAATSTEVRKNKIVEGIKRANFNQHPTVREFGFSVSNEFEKMDARILPPPTLGYDKKNAPPVSRGVWKSDRFFQAVTINKWTIVCADRRPPRADDLQKLAQSLTKEARFCGIQMKEPEQPYQTIGSSPFDIKKYFTSVKGKYDVIFVVVPNSGPQYGHVKTAAEINVGCLTQCIKLRTVFKMNPQTALNLLLKVNAKLNGTNHVMANRPPIMSVPTMIMGADVTHPSPDSTHIPSVAAVTASHDPKAFKYNICWRLQPPKQEIIEDLENIVVEQLKYFYEQNRQMKPQRIIFFRDGVSDGQFEQVTSAEIRAIRAACKRVQSEDYEPAITFLVVQKRHHTRLFPLNPRDSEDRNVNVPAGTCVDTHITHPFMQDFYLVSHASIQGVAKPTKYCTLWDDNNMSNDAIEQLTYFLCHMFTRCNRSVSYPAPTYYAHLAAARAKVYIEQENLDLNNLNNEYTRFKIQDSIQKLLPMFFV